MLKPLCVKNAAAGIAARRMKRRICREKSEKRCGIPETNLPGPGAGLDPGKRYRITELNVDGKPVPQDGKTFSGAFLMENGLEFTVGKEYASRVLELKAVE